MNPRLFLRLLIALIAIGFVLILGPQANLVAPVRAAGNTITVTTATDEDTANSDCSLREAVKAAKNNAAYRGCAAGSATNPDIIDFNFTNDTTISLSSSSITIDSSVIIQNTTGHTVAIEQSTTNKGLFRITATDDVTFNNVTLQNADTVSAITKSSTTGNLTFEHSIIQGIDNNLASPGSGNVLNSAGGTLTFKDTTVTNNSNAAGTLGTGGVIKSTGPVVISGSTFSNNANLTGSGHNVASGGVIYGKTDVTIYNSTFSGNANPTGTVSGGAVYVDSGTLKIDNVTFYNNGNGSGGSSHGRVISWDSSVSTTIDNTIMVGYPDGKACSTTPTSYHNNFIDTSCGFTLESSLGALTGFDTTLNMNGGPTQTHKLSYGSNAIDSGYNNAASDLGLTITTDQRGAGFPRPYPFAGTVDIGAFEFQGAPDIKVEDEDTNEIDDSTGAFTFPGTTPGTPVQETFTITNTGTADLTVSNVNLPGSGFSLVGTFPSTAIAPDDSDIFTVQCDALSVGTYTLNLSFSTNVASPADTFSFGLTCAVGTREITVLKTTQELPSGSNVTFNYNQTRTFTVRNDGGGAGSESVLHLDPVDLNNEDDFSLVSDIGTSTLNPGDTTTFSVQCTTKSEHHSTATVLLGSDDSDEDPYVLKLDCVQPEGNHEAAATTQSTDVSNAFCANLGGQTGGSMTGGAGQSVLNNVFGDVYCSILVQDSVMSPNSAAAIGDPDVLQKGVIQAVNVYGLLPGGASTDTFVAPVQICLRGSGPVLWLHFDPVAQKRVVTVLPSTESNGYACADVPGAGVVVLDGFPAASSAPVADAAPTQPPSNTLNNCSVTTLYAARLRAEPNTSSDVLTTVPYNLTLHATEATDGWYRVIYGDQQGWISAELLSTAGDCG